MVYVFEQGRNQGETKVVLVKSFRVVFNQGHVVQVGVLHNPLSLEEIMETRPSRAVADEISVDVVLKREQARQGLELRGVLKRGVRDVHHNLEG